jgi:CHAT domain-containing protein
VGARATANHLRQLERDGTLAEYSCLHFSTHGDNIIVDRPMESRFYLQDSLLDGLELANLRLGADTVVLSACCSGHRSIAGRGLNELQGDDLFGLQAAFFRAGANYVSWHAVGGR